MQVTETLSEGLKRAYTVVVPAADIESKRAARLANLGKTLNLPGFRPGKVPLMVVRQRYGTAVTAEVLEESVSEATQQVLTDRGLRPALQPRIDVVSLDAGSGAAKDLEFKVELELLPDITLPDFSNINLERMRVEVAAEPVDKALAEIAQRNRDLVEITADELGDRGAASGEVLAVDYVGRVEGVEFPGGTGNDIDVELGGGGFIPGFSEQLAGMKPGESRTIDVTFPAEYGATNLAGKAATFDVTAKKLSRAVVPPIDDELAKKLGFDDLAAMREAITRRIQAEYDQLSRLRLKRQLLDALAEVTSFASPDGMVEQEFSQIWQRLEADRKEGRLDDDDKDKDEETLKADYRAIAERRVRLGLLLAEIGRVNSITVAPDEMTRAMRMEASRYPGQEQQIFEFFRQNPRATDSLRGPLFEEKVIDFITELAKVEEKTVTPEELAKEPEVAGAAAT
ncbi:MAG TPA: trigger factor [Acetobacteraceae bacterium]|jgi:trigger factor|nr:trigger factor [Acetobacteraceae bacterium]